MTACKLLIVGKIYSEAAEILPEKNSFSNADILNERVKVHLVYTSIFFYAILVLLERRSASLVFRLCNCGSLFWMSSMWKNYQMCDFKFFTWSRDIRNSIWTSQKVFFTFCSDLTDLAQRFDGLYFSRWEVHHSFSKICWVFAITLSFK